MLIWIAIVIAALALFRIWQIVSRDKMKRDFKQRDITRRLKTIEERDENIEG